MTGKAGELFEEDDEESVEKVQININRTFAKEYQSRKQREELRSVQQERGHQLGGDQEDDDESSSDDSEDENGDLLTPSMDVTILKTINALRNKDQSIYDPNIRFFPKAPEGGDSENDDDDDDDDESREKKHKPKRFKDVLREQILEQMDKDDNGQDESMENENFPVDGNDEAAIAKRLAYNQEQKALRSAFLDSTKDDANNSDDDDWMTPKDKRKPEEQEDEAKVNQLMELELEALEKSAGRSKLLDPRGEIQDGERFLLDFIKNKKWIDKDDKMNDDESSNGETEKRDVDKDDDDEDGHDSDDSIEQLEKMDEFESKYNFRFEEAQAAAAGTSGADFSVIGYARSGTMNTLRRKDDARKLKRDERKERKAAERKAKEEQLRRLKNAKREEMEAKVKQIKAVLGEVEERGTPMDEATILKLMEGDYDPEKFEDIMRDAYGDDFYQQEDTEWRNDVDVRQSLLKDEDGNMIVGQDDPDGGLYDNLEEGEEGEGMDQDTEGQADEWDETQDDDDDAFPADDGQPETETERKLKETMMNELYKLDYEDIVAGMPTRFKYRQVEPNNFGLSTEEILFARDTTLKSFVSLKKLAPYTEGGEYFVGGKKRRRFREMLKQDIEDAIQQQEQEGMPPLVRAEDEVDDAQPIKTRRRQKKGKKANDETGKDLPAEEPVEIEEVDPVQTENGDDEATGKRGRKKRGKKSRKVEASNEETNVTSINETEESNIVPPEAMVDKEKVSEAEKLKAELKKAKKAKQKIRLDDTKRKKAKTITVEGLSASRLASYGL